MSTHHSSLNYLSRRKTLLNQLSPNSAAIIASAHPVLRNGDNHFPFRQDSHFYYLSGFPESNAVILLLPNRQAGEFILFCERPNPERTLWDGAVVGQTGACSIYGANEAFDIANLETLLPDLLKDRTEIFLPLHQEQLIHPRFANIFSNLARQFRTHTYPAAIHNLNTLIDEQRVIKSDEEIDRMRTAAKISSQAHIEAMRYCRPGMYEYQLEAKLLETFYQGGCRSVAYPSIVASGPNSCILHYHDNQRKMLEGDLVLIDAGGEYQNYASDISRTFPASGRFSDAQKAVYELVLKAQLAGIEKIKPKQTWDTIDNTITEIITDGLIKLGLLKGQTSALIQEQAYRKFYPHRFGHWLGLDVHDVGTYRIHHQSRPLQPNMVFTVEPGIYIQPDEHIDRAFWHIGIRIEDDVAVTANGCEVLSNDAPKVIQEIETLCNTSRS